MLQQKYIKNFDKAKKVLDDYQKAVGNVGPNDEFHTWVISVDNDRAEEAKRQKRLADEKREKEEREKRQKDELEAMAKIIAEIEKDLASECVVATEAGMMAQMVVEQAKPVITDKDFTMVGDMKPFVDQAKAELTISPYNYITIYI